MDGEIITGIAVGAGVGAVLGRIAGALGGLLGRGGGAAASAAIRGVDDIFLNPQLLAGKAPAQIANLVRGSSQWVQTTLGRGAHQGQGMVLREVNSRGNLTGRMIQWHPGGGHHGPSPYWKVSSPGGGTVRIQ